MSKKINLDKFCDENEQVNEEKQMRIYKSVIDDYSKLCGVNFRKENKFARNDYDVFDSLLQITVANPQFFQEFHEILDKYGFDDKTYIDYAIKKITNNASNMEAFIKGLIDVGVVENLYDENNLIYLESYGGTYKFLPANEYYSENKEIISYMKKGQLNGNCHVSTLFLLKTLKQGEAVTAKCSTMFNGSYYYHSYYRESEMICDLNINCVMSEEEYNSIYHPKIISVVNLENLKEKQNMIRKTHESTLEDLLEIAVYEEILKK